jgi:hypothetical protein
VDRVAIWCSSSPRRRMKRGHDECGHKQCGCCSISSSDVVEAVQLVHVMLSVAVGSAIRESVPVLYVVCCVLCVVCCVEKECICVAMVHLLATTATTTMTTATTTMTTATTTMTTTTMVHWCWRWLQCYSWHSGPSVQPRPAHSCHTTRWPQWHRRSAHSL